MEFLAQSLVLLARATHLVGGFSRDLFVVTDAFCGGRRVGGDDGAKLVASVAQPLDGLRVALVGKGLVCMLALDVSLVGEGNADRRDLGFASAKALGQSAISRLGEASGGSSSWSRARTAACYPWRASGRRKSPRRLSAARRYVGGVAGAALYGEGVRHIGKARFCPASSSSCPSAPAGRRRGAASPARRVATCSTSAVVPLRTGPSRDDGGADDDLIASARPYGRPFSVMPSAQFTLLRTDRLGARIQRVEALVGGLGDHQRRALRARSAWAASSARSSARRWSTSRRPAAVGVSLDRALVLSRSEERLIAAVGGVARSHDPRQLDVGALSAGDPAQGLATGHRHRPAWDWRGSPISTKRASELIAAPSSHRCSRVDASAASSCRIVTAPSSGQPAVLDVCTKRDGGVAAGIDAALS